jgi:acetoin utilization deacetylase AcuC-like enzyme
LKGGPGWTSGGVIYARIGSAIVTLGMPVVAVQEGGYGIEALGVNSVALLGAIHPSATERAPKRHD